MTLCNNNKKKFKIYKNDYSCFLQYSTIEYFSVYKKINVKAFLL